MDCWMRFVAHVLFIFHLKIYFVAFLMLLNIVNGYNTIPSFKNLEKEAF